VRPAVAARMPTANLRSSDLPKTIGARLYGAYTGSRLTGSQCNVSLRARCVGSKVARVGPDRAGRAAP
jgi:hypothetical protein